MARGGKLKLVKWHLGEEELAKLEQLKEETGTSMAEHTRRAINLYFETMRKDAQQESAPEQKTGPRPMHEVELQREGNVLLSGASRSGKTWAMKPWVAQSVRDGDCVIILDTCIGKELLECALQSAYQSGRSEDVYFFDAVPAEEDIEACFAAGSVPVALFHFENTFIFQTEQYEETLHYVLHDFLKTVKEYAARSAKTVHLFIDEAHRVLYSESAAFVRECAASNVRAYISIGTVETALAKLTDEDGKALLASFATKYFFRPASPRSLQFARAELVQAGLAEQRIRPLETLRPQVYYVVVDGTAKVAKLPEMLPLFLTMNGIVFKGSHNAYPVSVKNLPELCKDLQERGLTGIFR